MQDYEIKIYVPGGYDEAGVINSTVIRCKALDRSHQQIGMVIADGVAIKFSHRILEIQPTQMVDWFNKTETKLAEQVLAGV